MIEVREITTKKEKKQFFKFYIDLYKNNPYATPNLYADEFSEFDPEINDAFRFCDCKMFLAYKDGKIAGRVAGIHHKYVNEKNNVKQLRFTRFDVIDDFEVTRALFMQLQNWAKELGLKEIIGPMSFSDLNEEGMLIEGFDRPAAYIEIYNFPYYLEHMQKLGAKKAVDWNSYYIPVPKEPDTRLQILSEKLCQRYNLEVVDVATLTKTEIDEIIFECLTMLDEEFANLYGTSALSDKQKIRFTATIKQALIPEFASMVKKDGQLIGYGFAMPSLTKVLQKAKGSVIPRGLFAFIKAMKNPKVADLMSIAVKKEYQKLGVPAIIMNDILKGFQKHKVQFIETGPELEDNLDVQNLWKNYNPELHKRRRCWTIPVKGR